jgi:Fe-S-cluster containining protein
MTVHVSIGERQTGTDEYLKDVCLECGSHCCKLGGVVATQNEVDAITERGFPNYFIRLSDEVYGIEWGEDGTCAYLEDGRCTIYPVRPLGCRMFPVVQTRSNDIILIECKLAEQLTEEDLETRKRVLKQRPIHIIRESSTLREDHIHDLQMRAAKYNHQKL